MARATVTGSTRRRFLRAGGLFAVGLAGCVVPDGAREDEDRNPDLNRDRRTRNRDRTRTDEGEFPAAVTDRARAVGERVRPAVVVLQPPDSATSGMAWFLEVRDRNGSEDESESGEGGGDDDGGGDGDGDGDGEGYLLTNGHVLDELGGDLRAHTVDGTSFDVTVERRRESPDLALLSAAGDPPAVLPLGRSTALERGQPLVQIGHTRISYWTIGLGAFRRRLRFPSKTWVLTEMPVMLGNSGSPLLTLDGRVVGLTFGTVPKDGTPPSEDPTPGPPRVYEEYPRQTVRYGGHVSSETLQRYVDRWTG